jgi:hypothetical protein
MDGGRILEDGKDGKGGKGGKEDGKDGKGDSRTDYAS